MYSPNRIMVLQLICNHLMVVRFYLGAKLGQVGEWLIPADCKSALKRRVGSNPTLSRVYGKAMLLNEAFIKARLMIKRKIAIDILCSWLKTNLSLFFTTIGNKNGKSRNKHGKRIYLSRRYFF